MAFATTAVLALLVLSDRIAVAIGIFSVLLAVILLLSKRQKRLTIIAMGAAFGLFWCVVYQMIFLAPVISCYGQTTEISGVATDYSTESANGIRVSADIEALGINANAMVWLNTKEELTPGDTFTVEAKLTDSRQDGSYFYWSDGVYLLAYGTAEPQIQQKNRIFLRYLPRYIAHQLEESLKNCVSADVQGYAVALTTGNRNGLSSLEKSNLKTSGIYHALALSGMHLTTLLGILFLLVYQKWRRALIGIPLSIVFTIITGATPSMVRACVMQCLVLLAPVFNREEDAPTSLGAAALLLIMQNPCCILGWGTQLSFASMTGIILLSEKLQRTMLGDRRKRKKWTRRTRKCVFAITGSLSATVSATALSLPLMMLHFGMFSLIAPLTNLLTGAAIAWAFRLSLLTGILGTFLPGLGRGVGWILAWCIRYVSGIAGMLSKVPFAALYTSSAYVIIWIVACYSILLLLVRTPKGQRRFFQAICCGILILSVCIVLSLAENIGFVFTVLDVGQGQCLLARMNDQTVMIDCGGSGNERVGDMAASYLDSLGEQRVDLLLLTHYDTDHVGGVPELLQRMQVAQILMPEYPSDARREIEFAAAASGTKISYVQRELRAEAGGCRLAVYETDTLGPDNNESLSVFLKFGQTEILVTGDMDAAGERQLLREHPLPDIDVLVAGHHGSKYSTSQTLLSELLPEIVVISVGKNNYGHPAEETLSRISDIGAVIYRTDLHGTIRLKGA